MWQEQMVRTLRNIIIHHHIEISKSGNCPAERPYLVWSDWKKVVKRQILSGTLIERESTRKL